MWRYPFWNICIFMEDVVLNTFLWKKKSLRNQNHAIEEKRTLCKMCPYSEFFWSLFCRIWTKDIRGDIGNFSSSDKTHDIYVFSSNKN